MWRSRVHSVGTFTFPFPFECQSSYSLAICTCDYLGPCVKRVASKQLPAPMWDALSRGSQNTPNRALLGCLEWWLKYSNWNWNGNRFKAQIGYKVNNLINIYCCTRVKSSCNQAWKRPEIKPDWRPVGWFNAASYSFIKTARRDGGVGVECSCWRKLQAFIHLHSLIHSFTIAVAPRAPRPSPPRTPRSCPLWKIVFPGY